MMDKDKLMRLLNILTEKYDKLAKENKELKATLNRLFEVFVSEESHKERANNRNNEKIDITAKELNELKSNFEGFLTLSDEISSVLKELEGDELIASSQLRKLVDDNMPNFYMVQNVSERVFKVIIELKDMKSKRG